MAERSKIEWTDSSWNPIRARDNVAPDRVGWHCEKVSEACRNCYAEGMNRRLGTGLEYKPGNLNTVELLLDEKMLLAPLRWQKPRKIFVCSTTDLFGDWVKDEWLDRIFAVMALCPQHTFQCLTKRPKRMREYFEGNSDQTRRSIVNNTCFGISQGLGARFTDEQCRIRRWPLPNVWLGVTAEDQPAADARIPDLLATPAAVRFVSIEPMLGPVDVACFIDGPRIAKTLAKIIGADINGLMDPCAHNRLDLVISGGESGPHARPTHPDWERSIRDQCAAAGVAYFRKQAGEYAHDSQPNIRTIAECISRCEVHVWPDGSRSYRVGKRRAGRLLDGV